MLRSYRGYAEPQLTDDERVLLAASGLTGTLTAVGSREPLRTHPSQVILLLRGLPAARVELPTTKRGTIVVWQTPSGTLSVYPPDAELVEPPEWSLRPNDQGNAMLCYRGSCGFIMHFD